MSLVHDTSGPVPPNRLEQGERSSSGIGGGFDRAIAPSLASVFDTLSVHDICKTQGSALGGTDKLIGEVVSIASNSMLNS
jgi:hypothetical protein